MSGAHRSLTDYCRTCGVSIDEEYAGEQPFDEWDIQCWRDEHQCIREFGSVVEPTARRMPPDAPPDVGPEQEGTT